MNAQPSNKSFNQAANTVAGETPIERTVVQKQQQQNICPIRQAAKDKQASSQQLQM